MPKTPFLSFTDDGNGVMAASFDTKTNVVITEVRLTVKVAPITAEDFTAIVDSDVGPRYDLGLITQDMLGVTAFLQTYEGSGISFRNGEPINFAWANSDGREWGLEVKYRLGV